MVAPVPVIDVNDAELLSLFRDLLAREPPVPKPKQQRPPRTRVWVPDFEIAESKLAEIIGRHPALLDPCLSSAPSYDVRKASRSVFRGRQGYFHSRKMGRTMHFRSRLEYSLMRICEVDRDVLGFVEQPVVIKYQQMDGRLRTYTPDLFIATKERRTFYEVKWEADASTLENESRWPEVGKAFQGLRYAFCVATEATILRQPRQANITYLLRARRVPPVDPVLSREVHSRIENGSCRLRDLFDELPNFSMKHACRLILDGCLTFDFDLPLSGETQVLLSGGRHGTIPL